MNVQNLKIYIPSDDRTLVEGLSFTLKKGDKAVLIGEEGNGKSTLLKAVCGAGSVPYAVVTGNISAGEKIGYLAQELSSSGTVAEFFADTPFFGMSNPADRAEIAKTLKISPDIFFSPQLVNTLSGGEKVKIQIARLLLEQCDLLLLDEPSNDIDISTLIWLEDYIAGLQIPLLFVSHDETLIENTANMIIHIEQLRKKTVPRVTVARTDYASYVAERMKGIQKQAQVAQKQSENYQKKVRRWREIYEKVQTDLKNCSRQDPGTGRLLKKKMRSVKAQERRNEREKKNLALPPDFEEAVATSFPAVSLPSGKVVLDMSLGELSAGGKTLAKNIKLKITGPAHIAIIGKNGAGKTTLLKKIKEILLQNKDFKTAYMPQDYLDELDGALSPVAVLSDGTKQGLTDARTHLGCMRFRPEEMFRPLSELSGGQKAKLVYLKMVLAGSNVLLLDEPTRNFSPLTNPVIRRVLADYGGAIISVSHDRKYIDEVCDTVYELTENGLTEI